MHNDVSLKCDGKTSCQGANLSDLEIVECGGTSSCQNANINTAAGIRAYGDLALAGATVENVGVVLGKGYRSLNGATIDSGSLATMNVKVYGKSSGNNTRVICQSGNLCTVDCNGDSCDGLTYVCLGSATCLIDPAECLSDSVDVSSKGVICPTITDTLLELHEEEDELEANHDEVEADVKGQCYDKRECAGMRIKDSFLLCMGEEVCIDYVYHF